MFGFGHCLLAAGALWANALSADGGDNLSRDQFPPSVREASRSRYLEVIRLIR
jgi:hypothetical protein